MKLQIPLLHSYILRSFFLAFGGALAAFVSLFVVFDFFERLKTFIKEGSTVLQSITYVFLKVPQVVHLMVPVAVLIATLISVGKLSQLSEMTAMRASGASVSWLIRPLVGAGLLISVLHFLAAETIVPWANEAVEQLYNIDIKKKDETGRLSRENFWYRKDRAFYGIGYYNSKDASLQQVSKLEFDEQFRLQRRTDAETAHWISPTIGWSMRGITETRFDRNGRIDLETFKRLPLVIGEKPADFYNMQREPEEMSTRQLGRYIAKLRSEGVPVAKYLVDLSAKFSFPLVNAIAVLLAFPFALRPSRSGKMTASFICGIGLGFAYHFVHAVCLSLGGAELIAVLPAAWAANVIFLCLGLYLVSGAEFAK
jgi:lipopolysaccharide export system permease protein